MRILDSASLITENFQKREYTIEVPSVVQLELDFRLQSLECALMRNRRLRMRANEKPSTENTRSLSAILHEITCY